ncbi:AzlC family ABC transporter permease [Almyronema epifaneia]|uniref:AzlC family ABC transporter permease n=1 Tax=Almyronema epifaneia S1 TaxID=2991925 RepID=A0ABW6IHT2_9CYAN
MPQDKSASFWPMVLAGARDIVPLVIGAIPFGIIFGTLAQTSGLSNGGAIAMSAFVFAGSAQFIALGLLSSHTAVVLILLTTFVVNLRHLLYAASMVPYVKSLSPWGKIPFAFLLTDEVFAIAIGQYLRSDRQEKSHAYYFGAALLMYFTWQLCTWVGLTVGQLFPNIASWGLDFAMIATFIGMIVPYLVTRPMVVAVVGAGAIALMGRELPHNLGLLFATLGGIILGYCCEVFWPKPTVS